MSKTPTKEMIEAAQETYATFGQVGHLRAQPPAENVVAAMLSAALTAAPALDIDTLAQEIRRVDGNNDKGAGALAEALMPFLTAALQSAAVTSTHNSGEDRL